MASQQHERIINQPHQPGRIHFGRDRHNATITLREVAARGFHLSNEEADFLFLRIRFFLQNGQFSEAFTALTCQVLDLQAGRSIFTGFNTPGEMPLGMTMLSTRLLAVLERLEIFTIQQFQDAPDNWLLEKGQITPGRLKEMRGAVADVIRDYAAWRRTLRVQEGDA